MTLLVFPNRYTSLLFFFLAIPQSMWDLGSLTRDWTPTPCSGSVQSQPLNYQGSPHFSFWASYNTQFTPSSIVQYILLQVFQSACVFLEVFKHQDHILITFVEHLATGVVWQSVCVCVCVCVCACACPVLCCVWLCDPTDRILSGSSVHGISQARILESVAISSSRGSSQPRDLTWVSCIGRQIIYHCATWEALLKGLNWFSNSLAH